MSVPVWYHSPSIIIGEGLPPNEKQIYHEIRNEINRLFSPEPTLHVIFNVVRKFNNTDVLGMDESIPVLKCVIKYIRHIVLDTWSPIAFHKIVQLLDALVRKSGIRAHVLIGRKRFLQTLSLVARQWKKRAISNEAAHEAADYTFDCIQSWHEAFYDLRAIFPEYQIVYFKLVWKYRVQFPREEDDPDRIPIVLEQADDEALLKAGPDEFLLSEQVDTNPHLSMYDIYRISGSRDSFRGGFDTQDQLRAIGNKHNPPSPLGDASEGDLYDNASYPAADAPNTASPPSAKRPPLQQVVSQKSFQIKKQSSDASSAQFQILSPLKEDEDHHEEHNEGEVKDGANINELSASKSRSNDRNDDEQSVTIENRAYVVDGRIGIDTRAVINSPHASLPRKGSKASAYDPNAPNPKDYDPNADKAAYDHYKSEEKEKKLKSVPSHLYNQKSVRLFSNIEERIERFNSRDSMDSQRLTPGPKGHPHGTSSNNFGSNEEDKNVEIRFYGNQRVVIKK